MLLLSSTLKAERQKLVALAGNRTRASRVAGENSTTEPPMLSITGGGLLTKRLAVQAHPGTFTFCHDVDLMNKLECISMVKLNYKQKIMSKQCFSPSGNRSTVSRMTGGDTHHYTNEETTQELQKQWLSGLCICMY
ncbi:hypothetical protein ATANTOWER_027786 [Ataeniobius toweri]|uniref:Uncharacterized protein n=1 Tax=Ataeniobius toweri TaxID=208326 RepID=A0ABU7CM94_9TELE|nr:hypothetical protein [Ataeniobius toweri]